MNLRYAPDSMFAHVARLALLLSSLALVPTRASAQSGWGLGIADSEYYFTDLTRGRIVKIDSAGRLHALIADVHCHNLAPGYDGFIYGEAVGANRGGMGDQMAVWRLAASGERSWVMPPTAPPLDGVWVTRDALGNSYAWQGELERSSRIVRRTPEGVLEVLAGGAWGHVDGPGASARFAHVGALAVTREGVVYLTDSGHLRRIGLARDVETLARDLVSTKTGGVPGRADLFNHSVGLAVSENGTVYIADHYNLRVVRWDRNLRAAAVWHGGGWLSRLTGGGMAWYPGGIATEGGDTYVLEVLQAPSFIADLVGSPRILRIAPDGTETRAATVASSQVRLTVGALIVLFASALLVWRRRRARTLSRR